MSVLDFVSLCFLATDGNECWVLLIEKAMAKLFGSHLLLHEKTPSSYHQVAMRNRFNLYILFKNDHKRRRDKNRNTES